MRPPIRLPGRPSFVGQVARASGVSSLRRLAHRLEPLEADIAEQARLNEQLARTVTELEQIAARALRARRTD